MLTLLLTRCIGAMDLQVDKEKYDGNTDLSGTLIDAKTLPRLAKLYTPGTIRSALKSWFYAQAYNAPISENNAVVKYNKDIITQFAALPLPLSKYTEEGAIRGELLAKLQGSRSKSFNYIFNIVEGYRLYVTGLGNRINTLMSGQELVSGTWCDPYADDRQDKMQKDPSFLDNFARIPTYQMPSIFANYLLLKKYINQHSLKYVLVPDTYLVHIPGTPKEVRDDNYCVVQQVIQDKLLNLKTDPQAWSKISDQALKDLFMASKVGLWNIKDNLMINNEGQFVLLELEQPNNSDPRTFFNKKMVEDEKWGDIRGSKAWARYIVNGLEAIKTIITQAQTMCIDVTTKEVQNQTLWDTLERKRLLWLELIRQHPAFVQEYSSEQQNQMNALAKE